MKWFRRILLATVVAVVAFWIWNTFFPGPEKAIRRRLAEITRNATIAPGEGNITVTARAWRLANCFTTNAYFEIEWPERTERATYERDEIMRLLLGARTTVGNSFKIELLDPNISISADKRTAIVEVTLRATIPSDANYVVQELKMYFEKIDRKWFIRRVETMKTLSSL